MKLIDYLYVAFVGSSVVTWLTDGSILMKVLLHLSFFSLSAAVAVMFYIIKTSTEK